MSGGEQHTSVTAPGAKIATAWVATLFTSWADFASFLAAIYTLILLLEWCWKRFGREFAERHGWVKRLKRRSEDLR